MSMHLFTCSRQLASNVGYLEAICDTFVQFLATLLIRFLEEMSSL
uniref:Uncharacterized protein n=1 Tax=Arundo donax TaxID=35708 RepID=A0A0A9AQ53_ARUDO